MADKARAFVRVLGTRRSFVEFSFALGDPDLAVELILPRDAFEEFCARYDTVLVTTPSKGIADET